MINALTIVDNLGIIVDVQGMLENSLTLREALAQHLNRAGLTQETYGSWIPIKIGPFALRLPNPKFRQRTLILHDLHHVLTGYDTSFVGEGQVAAWEAKTGLAPHPMIWVFVLSAFAMGCSIAPAAMRQAWQRGRGGRNLFAAGFRPEMLDLTVGEMRRRCGLINTP